MLRKQPIHELVLDTCDVKRKKIGDESVVSKSTVMTTDCDEITENKRRRVTKQNEKLI